MQYKKIESFILYFGEDKNNAMKKALLCIDEMRVIRKGIAPLYVIAESRPIHNDIAPLYIVKEVKAMYKSIALLYVQEEVKVMCKDTKFYLRCK